MSARSTGLLFLAAMVWTWPATGADTARPDVCVRIYDSSGVMSRSDEAALDYAREALADADINVVWQRCFVVPCETPLRSGEMIVRIARSRKSAQAREPLVLGDAWVDPVEGTGVLATVYIDRVHLLAAEARVDVRRLLGRAIAHELGHLLLASTVHPPLGLMRATWRNEELQRDDRLDWTFAPTEAQSMARRALAMAARRSVPSAQVSQ